MKKIEAIMKPFKGYLRLQMNDEVGQLKKVEAIIKPVKLDEVEDALIDVGIQGITFSDVMGFGRRKGRNEFSKVKMEIIVADTLVPRVLETIRNCAKFVGRIGYHKIFVTDVMEVAHLTIYGAP